jgi:phage shock protein A
MGIISRFTDIMKANVNALLDKCEDPSKMVDQTLRDLNENLAQVKKETAGVMAEETRAKRNLDAATADVNKWDGYARKALTEGNEGDAREFLAKKAEATQKQADAQNVYNLAKDNADKMRAMHDKLVSDIQILEGKRETIKAKVAVAKTQESINKVTAGTDAAGTLRKFDDLESRVNKRLDTAMAEAELNSQPVDSATELTKKYDTGSASVESELARLKAEMGIQ